MHQKANIVAIGISVGLISAVVVILYTFLAYFFGYGVESEMIFDGFFPGYSLSLPGAIIGAIWAFSLGYLLAATTAWLYNAFDRKRE